MYAPINQHTAAGNGFVRKIAADSRNAAVSAKADINLINFAQFAVINQLLNLIDAGIKSVDNADV